MLLLISMFNYRGELMPTNNKPELDSGKKFNRLTILNIHTQTKDGENGI